MTTTTQLKRKANLGSGTRADQRNEKKQRHHCERRMTVSSQININFDSFAYDGIESQEPLQLLAQLTDLCEKSAETLKPLLTAIEHAREYFNDTRPRDMRIFSCEFQLHRCAKSSETDTNTMRAVILCQILYNV
jgi:hypothetical protein